jgi:DNA-binding CsgD family transcriptional regulator
MMTYENSTSLNFGNIDPELRKSSFVLFIVYILSATAILFVDLIIRTNFPDPISINITAITTIAAAVLLSGLFYFNKISFQSTLTIYSRVLTANLIFSDLVMVFSNFPGRELFILRDAFLFSVSLVVTGCICGRKHVLIQCLAYVIMLLTALCFSKGSFSPGMFFTVMLLVFGFSVTILICKRDLINILRKKLILQQEINKQERERYQQEAELMKARSDQFQDVLARKNRELTSKALQIAQHHEKCRLIAKRIPGIACLKGESLVRAVREIESELTEGDVSLSWSYFQKCFEEVHHEFYKKISLVCPELSPAERKLAAFIKLGLTSKEIASLTCNTTASVDVSRSRLRKKLELERNKNLESFLVDL